jgi:hypothetical protein
MCSLRSGFRRALLRTGPCAFALLTPRERFPTDKSAAGIRLWNQRKVYLDSFVQTVAAYPSGTLAFRDNKPCRLAAAGEGRCFCVAVVRMQTGETARGGNNN